ncbi:unnamed protein product, partial [Urochloa humidicola]
PSPAPAAADPWRSGGLEAGGGGAAWPASVCVAAGARGGWLRSARRGGATAAAPMVGLAVAAGQGLSGLVGGGVHARGGAREVRVPRAAVGARVGGGEGTGRRGRGEPWSVEARARVRR